MGDGENWTNWKFRKLNQQKIRISSSLSVNGISVLAIKKKLKNGHHFININHMEKYQISNSPKVWVSSFQNVNGYGISALTIIKKLKNGHYFVNINCKETFQITDPPMFESLVFWVLTEMEYQRQPDFLGNIKKLTVF